MKLVQGGKERYFALRNTRHIILKHRRSRGAERRRMNATDMWRSKAPPLPRRRAKRKYAQNKAPRAARALHGRKNHQVTNKNAVYRCVLGVTTVSVLDDIERRGSQRAGAYNFLEYTVW